MQLKSVLVGAAICSSTLSIAQDHKIDFVEYDLKNGMHVILHEDHTTPIVAVTVSYHVGSKNEDPSRTGFAHFFEHLLFEGSENIGRGEFMKIVKDAGGVLNANTSFDRTFYYEVLPSNQLELGLWLESERLFHAKIDIEGVETQRKVVKEELKQRNENTPYGSILNETFEHAFVEHPYQWTPGGSPKYINEAKLEEFIEFYKTFYVPNNATLSIAGDINPKQTKKLIKKYFGSIEAGINPIPRPTIVEPKKTEEVRDIVYDNIQLPAVIQAYHSPAQGTDDYYAVSMLAQLLSQGKSSRMQKTIVDEKQLAVAVGSFPLPSEDPGLTLNFGIANMGVEVMALEEAMNAEVIKVQNELISDKEFQKLRNQLENDFIQGNGTVAGIAESLSDYHVYFGEANLINTEIERYMKVSKEDLMRVAKKYFVPTNRVTLHYLPKSDENQ
ncbi:MAG: zinc protease [Flavobacteriales bacterium]|jgi:zinc protease